jgi:hypothetical protein
MRHPLSVRSLAFVLPLLVLGACGSAKKGESCDKVNIPSNCDDNLLCATQKSDGTGGLVCLPTCVGQEDCGANENCEDNGYGIPKVCRPK